MNASELVVNVKGIKGKKSKDFGEVKLADGVIYMSALLVTKKLQLLNTAIKEVLITEVANLYFDYNSANLSMTQSATKWTKTRLW